MSVVLDRVPGQPTAMAFLRSAAERPHHAYVFGGPEGSGKSIAARAFAATLMCSKGGCGDCRACRLAQNEQHPNIFIVEPEGRDIHVDTIRDEVWQPAYLTAPELGRKLFVIREADRLSPAAADTLLKVLEEPPADTVFLLLSARAHELPETIWSRCHVVTFAALDERFVIETLTGEGVSSSAARLAARLSGGNLGRARRMATDTDGFAFLTSAREALDLASGGPRGALAAADVLMRSAANHKKTMKAELDDELAPFLDERGHPEDAYRGAIRRIEIRFKRRERRAERDHIDRELLAASALLRDRIAIAVGADTTVMLDPSLQLDAALDINRAAASLAGMEQARASLAEDVNLNPRLVIESAFLQLSDYALRSA